MSSNFELLMNNSYYPYAQTQFQPNPYSAQYYNNNYSQDFVATLQTRTTGTPTDTNDEHDTTLIKNSENRQFLTFHRTIGKDEDSLGK